MQLKKILSIANDKSLRKEETNASKPIALKKQAMTQISRVPTNWCEEPGSATTVSLAGNGEGHQKELGHKCASR